MAARKTILVTGIGGNVGQGILRNLAAMDRPFRLIGINISRITPANYLCEAVYEVPYAYDSGYIAAIQQICEKEQVDLIIPATDYETLYLAQHASELVKVASSPYESMKIFVDKYATYQHFSKHGIPFAAAALPSEYQGEFEQCIAKPREGRGSRGLQINPTDFSVFDDETYMVQKLAIGLEITTAFYVDQAGHFVNHISFERTLVGGTTTFCTVMDRLDDKIVPIIEQLIASTPVVGSCNIQYIYTEAEEIVPFEINGRISGTNSIRSQFGFEDVKWTAEEFLFGVPVPKAEITKGSASRILLDVIYPESEDLSLVTKNSQFTVF